MEVNDYFWDELRGIHLKLTPTNLGCIGCDLKVLDLGCSDKCKIDECVMKICNKYGEINS